MGISFTPAGVPIKNLRSQAKRLSREQALKLCVAQDRVAAEQGFANWSDLIAWQWSVDADGVLRRKRGPDERLLVDVGAFTAKHAQMAGADWMLARDSTESVNLWCSVTRSAHGRWIEDALTIYGVEPVEGEVNGFSWELDGDLARELREAVASGSLTKFLSWACRVGDVIVDGVVAERLLDMRIEAQFQIIGQSAGFDYEKPSFVTHKPAGQDGSIATVFRCKTAEFAVLRFQIANGVVDTTLLPSTEWRDLRNHLKERFADPENDEGTFEVISAWLARYKERAQAAAEEAG